MDDYYQIVVKQDLRIDNLKEKLSIATKALEYIEDSVYIGGTDIDCISDLESHAAKALLEIRSIDSERSEP